jgi:hypothetical protein
MHWDIEECFAFKVLGPYSGALSAFWTEAWSEHRQSTNIGAFVGRRTTHQRQVDVDAAAAQGNLNLMPGTAVLTTSRATTNAQPITQDSRSLRFQQREQLTIHLARIQSDMSHYNALAAWNFTNMQHHQRIANLQQVYQACNLANDSIQANAIRAQLLALTSVELPGAPSAPVIAEPLVVPNVPQQDHPERNRQRNETSQSHRNNRSRPSPENDETDEREGAFQQQMAHIASNFCYVELGGEGNCVFFVFKYLQDHEIGSETLSAIGANVDENVHETRTRVANYLEERTREGSANRLLDASGVDISIAMADEHQSVAQYLDWIRRDGSSGGYIEIVAWANMCGVRVKVFSSVMFNNQLVNEELNWNVPPPCGGEVQTFYFMHHVGRGGIGGHYQLLQPVAAAAPAPQIIVGGVVHVDLTTSSNLSSVVNSSSAANL